jgi:putative hydroxymethylpyrimidine transport system substrate-binding protein
MRSGLVVAVAISMLVLAACGSDSETTPADTGSTSTTGSETAAPEPANLTVALDWFANPDHISLYYAQEEGFFEEQNLTVEFEVPSDPTAGLKLVASEEFDLSIFYQPDMFYAAAEGLPVVAVGSLVPQPLNSLMAVHDSKVQGPDDLAGSIIGHSGGPFNEAVLATILESQGLSADDVEIVNVGYDLVPAMLSGAVDATISVYFNIEGIHVESQTGEEPVIVRITDLGVPTYDELVVVANSERLASDPAYASAVERFMTAVSEAAVAAQADEARTIEIMKDVTEYTDEEIEAMVPDTLPLLTSPNGVAAGCFDLDKWAEFGDWMVDNGLLEEPVDSTTIVTNDYMPHCSA